MSNENSRKSSRLGDVSRRSFLTTTAAAGAAILTAPYIKTARAGGRKITVRDPGGPFTAGFKAAYYDPFKAETGIEVVGIQGEHEPTGMMKAMVEAKNYTWDGALLSKSSHQSLVNLGYLEPIAPKGGPGKHVSEVPESLRGEFILGNDVYATLIAYRKDVLGDNGPKNWADFWNTDKVPGARALRKHPFDTI
ncbi:MAG: extracellular solute-binding protein, partial [Gammaproteobacteria bacterium]|nr:extracellular solute-binding protein [Gammaproteobacteria bacterium]